MYYVCSVVQPAGKVEPGCIVCRLHCSMVQCKRLEKANVLYMVQSAGKGESGCIVLYHMYSVLYHVCSVVGSAMQAARKGEPGCRSDTVIAALCCVIMPIVAVLYFVISCV